MHPLRIIEMEWLFGSLSDNPIRLRLRKRAFAHSAKKKRNFPVSIFTVYLYVLPSPLTGEARTLLVTIRPLV